MVDAQAALRAAPWLAPMPKELGVRVFDLCQSFSAECERHPQAESNGHPRPDRAPELIDA